MGNEPSHSRSIFLAGTAHYDQECVTRQCPLWINRYRVGIRSCPPFGRKQK